jgi:O-antigen biosynthesis protein
MSVLALLPDDALAPMPDFPSYQWVIIRASDLHENDPAATQRLLHYSFVVHQPALVISMGDIDSWTRKGVASMPYNFARLWLHFENMSALAEPRLTAAFLESRRTYRDEDHPLISVVTSTYKSGHKLQRAYQSLQSQTYDYWEWVIWDDSPDQDTYAMVQAMAAEDMRIQVYKAPQRSGIIGEMKYRSASLSSGQWLVELDHDDRIAPQLFEWVRNIGRRYPDTKFIYSDHAELFEEGDAPFSYGELYGYNYGAYTRQHIRSHANGPLLPHYISRSAWPNPITLQHLVGLPNHVRIWKRSFYESIGRHRTDLPVADDYDLLIKSFLAANPGEWVCIMAPSYYQYRNSGGNNFTFKRNALIQHLVQQLYSRFYPQLVAKYDTLGWPRDIGWPSAGVWETELPDVQPRMERYFVPEDQDPDHPCISIILPTYQGGQALKQAIDLVVGQTYSNWKLFIIGDGCPELDPFATQELPQLYPNHLHRIVWYNLAERHDDGFVTARNYALRMIVKTEWVAYSEQDDGDWGEKHLEGLIMACSNEKEEYTVCAYVDQKDATTESKWRGGQAGSLLHRRSLLEKHGYWKKGGATTESAAEELFRKWANEPWKVVVRNEV